MAGSEFGGFNGRGAGGGSQKIRGTRLEVPSSDAWAVFEDMLCMLAGLVFVREEL